MRRHMNPAPRIVFAAKVRARDARRRGQLDATDAGVGVVLLVVVPVLVYFVGAFFIEDHYVAQMGKKAQVDAPPDQEEVKMHLLEAQTLLKANAPHYLKLMKVTTNGALRDKYRQWAQRALVEGLSKLGEVDSMIEEHPDGPRVFSSDLQKRTAQMRYRGEADLKRVRELDILGSDQ